MSARPSARRSFVRAGLAAAGISLSVMVGAGVVAAAMGWPGAAERGASPDRPSTGQDSLQAEIDAMLAAGFAPDDPKVRLLQEELDALEALARMRPVPEPKPEPVPVPHDPADAAAGAGSGAQGAGGAGAETGVDAGTEAGATELWDDGTVECEPIPQQLTVEDIAGATCYVEPRADGTVRYVAVAPDGQEREVIFGTGAAG